MLHSLRHSFAGVAEQLGATIPTIAALLGHRVGGVTGGYILKRVDVLLVDAANRVADHIEKLMRGELKAGHPVQRAAARNKRPCARDLAGAASGRRAEQHIGARDVRLALAWARESSGHRCA